MRTKRSSSIVDHIIPASLALQDMGEIYDANAIDAESDGRLAG
jgi:hypothetical protein